MGSKKISEKDVKRITSLLKKTASLLRVSDDVSVDKARCNVMRILCIMGPSTSITINEANSIVLTRGDNTNLAEMLLFEGLSENTPTASAWGIKRVEDRVLPYHTLSSDLDPTMQIDFCTSEKSECKNKLYYKNVQDIHHLIGLPLKPNEKKIGGIDIVVLHRNASSGSYIAECIQIKLGKSKIGVGYTTSKENAYVAAMIPHMKLCMKHIVSLLQVIADKSKVTVEGRLYLWTTRELSLDAPAFCKEKECHLISNEYMTQMWPARVQEWIKMSEKETKKKFGPDFTVAPEYLRGVF